jgi:eukaryotic-like serine/threonine-protein kinase
VKARRVRLDVDLRGVFGRDGATTAADPSLPLDVFVTIPGARLPGGAAGSAQRHEPNTLRGVGPSPPVPSTLRGPAATKAPPRTTGRTRNEEILPRGTIIDKYRIDRLLGRGGFAAVYRATHLLLDTRVALKLLRPQVVARHPYLAKLLHEEARFAARIDHPNVVKVYDVTHSSSITYVVMEYIDGRSLAETIRRSGPLAPARVVEIGTAVIAGLRVALAAGLIHRDIKPANILLGRRGETKIVDLGLVLRTDTSNHERTDPEAPPARRASTIGTYGYMAPEQAVDPDGVDFRADIYSLGVTLYEAAVGEPPFPLADAPRCLEMHARAPVPPPEERSPGVPRALSALLLRMLAKNPDDRFPSYDALAEAFARAAATLAPAAATTPTTGR